MKVCIYPKPELMATWSADREQMDKATNPVPTCLRCGRPIDRGIANNAFSRALDVYVCASCGMDEAMEDYHGQYLRLVDWDAVRRARTIPPEEASIWCFARNVPSETPMMGLSRRIRIPALRFQSGRSPIPEVIAAMGVGLRPGSIALLF